MSKKEAVPAPLPAAATATELLQTGIDGYRFGYELTSWTVRKYRINDMQTVRAALCDSIEDYLVHEHGYVQCTKVDNIKLSIGFLAIVIASLPAVVPIPYPQSRPLLLACVVLFAACMAVAFYVLTRLETAAFFDATAKGDAVPLPAALSPDEPRPTKLQAWWTEVKRSWGGNKSSKPQLLPQRLRLCATVSPFRPYFEIHAQLLELTAGESGWRPRKVLTSVAESWPIGAYFDRLGFIYPPNMKRDLDALLAKLGAAHARGAGPEEGEPSPPRYLLATEEKKKN